MLGTVALLGISSYTLVTAVSDFVGNQSRSLQSKLMLTFKRYGVFAETKESKDHKKLYPKYIRTEFEGAFHHPILFYSLPPGLSFVKIFEHKWDIESALQTTVQIKWLEGNDKDRADIRIKIMVGKMRSYIEWDYEELAKLMTPIRKKNNNEGYPFPIGFSRDKMEFIDFANDNSPHIYFGGETGGGKSSLARSMIMFGHLFYKPEELRFYYMDLKDGTEAQIFYDTPFTDSYVRRPQDAERFLLSLLQEEYSRLELFQKNKVVNFKDYNRRNPKNKLPRILCMIDELSLLEGKEFEKCRDILQVITAFGRAVGVNLAIGSHRPDNKVMSGTMKMNISIKIAFWCNPVSARVILDENNGKAMEYLDAEVQGRALYYWRKLIEIQVPFLHPDIAEEMISEYFPTPPPSSTTQQITYQKST